MTTILMPGSRRHAMRRSALSLRLAAAGAVLSIAGVCPAQTSNAVTLNFEGLKNAETVSNYYNGGQGGKGSGPGPNYGITFGPNGLA